MSEYIRQAILSGILETFEMTLFASLFSYLIGMPLAVLAMRRPSSVILRFLFLRVFFYQVMLLILLSPDALRGRA